MKILEHRQDYLSADAEGRAKLLAKTYGLSRHQMWTHKQSGKWIVSHSGVEQIAALEGLSVSYDVVAMDPAFVVFMGRAVRDGFVGQPTTGEASPKNTQQAHIVAMAEKRCFDRAVLKAVLGQVGGHGGDFYSEEEADDFRVKSDSPAKPAAANSAAPADKWRKALSACKTVDDVNRTFRGFSAGLDKDGEDYAQLVSDCADRKQEVQA